MELYRIAISRYKLTSKIPTGHPFWKEFNAGFRNVFTEPDMLMQHVYDGRSITTWHANNWRAGENYECGQHIGLDFDAGDKTSSLEHLVKDPFIVKYAAFAYTTMSHTPDCPRARVVFLLDQPIMQAKNYTLAASALLWLFGTADRQCKDAARFFYGSPNCNFEFPNQVLPLEKVKKLIAEYQATGLTEKRRSAPSGYRPPASQQEVADALAKIPPWGIGYDEWIQVLMALHHEFGDDGYRLAENWADGKQGEVEQKWKSFKAAGNTSGAVTIATVYKLAKDFGWTREGVVA